MSEQDNFKEELAKIDERIETLEKNVQMGKDMKDLHEDERFKRLFVEGYFDAEETRIASLLFTPSGLKRDQMENIMDKATGIRNCKQYLATVLIDAAMAPDQIEEEKNYRAELTANNSIVIEEK